jgi:hypothetical protein
VFFLSLSARKPVCKPLDEEGNDQNIPHGSVYFAGIAVYITLGSAIPRSPEVYDFGNNRRFV